MVTDLSTGLPVNAAMSSRTSSGVRYPALIWATIRRASCGAMNEPVHVGAAPYDGTTVDVIEQVLEVRVGHHAAPFETGVAARPGRPASCSVTVRRDGGGDRTV
jgi:hypothetical protein